MSTAKEQLHTLVDQVPEDKAERALKLLRHILQAAPDNHELQEPGSDEAMRQLMRRHWRRVGDRTGLDVDRLPKNGAMSGGVSGDRVELTKDWEPGDARHRLSKLDVQGHEIILLERMARNDSELRSEVRVFTEASEGRAAVSVSAPESTVSTAEAPFRAFRKVAARAQSYSRPSHRSRQTYRRLHSSVCRQS
jgi:hypothetical protein